MRRKPRTIEPASAPQVIDSPPDPEASAHSLRVLAAAKTPNERRKALCLLARTLGEDLGTNYDPLQTADRMEEIVRTAVESLIDGEYRAAAERLLTPSSGMNLTARRAMAADRMRISVDTFRRRYEKEVLREVALRLQTTQRHSMTPVNVVGHEHRPTARKQLPGQRRGSSREEAVLSEVLSEVDEAVLLIGSLLLVKTGARLVGKTLSTDQLSHVRTSRTNILADPAEALRFLLEAEGVPGN